jgi:hypothetical protein
MSNIIELEYLDGIKYSPIRNGKFLYNTDDDTVSGNSCRGYFLNRKIKENSVYITSGNRQVAVPLLIYKLEKNNITAKVNRGISHDNDIIVEFPDEAELSFFLFRMMDIIGYR